MPRATLSFAAFFFMILAAPVSAQQGSFAERPWHLALDLWGAGIDGTVGTPLTIANVSSDPFDDVGGFGTLTWHEPDGRLGFLAALYVMDTNPSGSVQTGAGPVPTSADVDNSIFEAAFSWNFGQPASRFEIFGGVRHWDLDAKSSSPMAGTASFGDSWNDLLVGASFAPQIGDGWWLDFRLDYSGGESEGIWGALAALTWAFNDSAAVNLGVKYLNADFTTSKGVDNFNGDIELFGPSLGIEFAF